MVKRWVMLVLLLALSVGVRADSVEGQFRSAIHQRYGQRQIVYTLVPYKNTWFGSSCSKTMNQLNQPEPGRWVIWEYVGGRWSVVFEFNSIVDADEGSAQLNTLFKRYRFSPQMRAKLMYGTQKPL